MKKNLILILGVLCATLTLANGQFEKAMGKNIPAMFSAETPEAMQAVINNLNRIGEAEGDRWEPYYYVAFGYLRMSDMVEAADDKDKYLDLAMKAVDKGAEIKPNDSELEAMRGYVQMIKLAVDPATRGMTYSGLAFASFQKALALDPNNPRAHFLMGRMQYGTAQFMGSGTDEACGSLFKALVMFDKVGEPENPFAPTWGKNSTEQSIKQLCEKGDGE
ncbi:tetratricopeptide repeat protein [Ekhidna sp. To15]|uniref:tetratricopeptide repeat protein n=1 Tax=Ekhidna sp. To15 TaxID=3395267 RepID=UPI003F52696C